MPITWQWSELFQCFIVIMAALRSRCGHYIFVLFLLFLNFIMLKTTAT